MFAIVRSNAAAALACGLLCMGCALDSGEPTTNQTDDELGFFHRARYELVKMAEYRGQSTTATGSARWYMPTIVEDQDGDGNNDLLLGQPYGSSNSVGRQGAVRILSGSDLSELRLIGPDDIDASYEGTFGYSAHSLGDINFDGHTDFAIGSPVIRGRNPDDGTLDPAGYNNTGITWIAKSRSDGGFDVDRILGDDPRGYLGYWMAPVSFNLPRLFRHGAPGTWRGFHMPLLGLATGQAKFRGGRVWGIEPRTQTVMYKASDDPANNDTISERRGYFIAATDDLNGNGFTDIMATANGQWVTGDPDPRQYAGRIYFTDGLTGELIRVIEGANPTQSLGNRSAARQIDDINHDGVDDFLIGSGVDGGVSGLASGGVAYVISGRAIRSSTDKVLNIGLHPEIVLRTHTGTFTSDLLGDNFANLFDMDGDGVDEYAIGAFGNTSTTPFTGSVLIYSGRTGELVQRIDGEAANVYFGQYTLADRENGTLYVADVYYPDPTTHRSIGRVSLYKAIRIEE